MFLSKDVDELYNRFAEKPYEPGALDAKTKELIAVACSVMADCPPCIEWHYKQAVEQGANETEIAEALAITMTISAGSKRAKYGNLINELSRTQRR